MNCELEINLKRLGILPDMLTARGLCTYEEARELEIVQVDSNGREHSLAPMAATAWRGVKAAAADAGIDLIVVSAFRSISRQAEIIQRKLDAGIDIGDILKVSAAPGYSEHHTGRAVDIATPGGPCLEVEFELTNAFAWLQRNANEFGFCLSYPRNNPWGYQYEPWHWCFNMSNVASDAEVAHSSA